MLYCDDIVSFENLLIHIYIICEWKNSSDIFCGIISYYTIFEVNSDFFVHKMNIYIKIHLWTQKLPIESINPIFLIPP